MATSAARRPAAHSRPLRQCDLFQSASSASANINMLRNLMARDLGLIDPLAFCQLVNSRRLDELRLSKTRSVTASSHSITWFSLDRIDERFLLAAKSDGNFSCVDLWQGQTSPGNHTYKFLFDSASLPRKTAHEFSISGIQWYPVDTGLFFTSGMDRKVKVWDTNSLQVVDEYALNHKIYNHHVSSVMASNCQTLIALALDNGQVRLVDVNSGSFTHTLKAHHQHTCVSVQWSPTEANLVASGGSDGQIAFWDVRSSKACLMYLDADKSTNLKRKRPHATYSGESTTSKYSAHTDSVLGLAFTHDGQQLVSFGNDSHLRLWNVATGLNTLVNFGRVSAAAAAETCVQLSCSDSCQKNYVFVPSENNLLMYRIGDGELVKRFKGHFDPINCCTFNSTRNELYTGARDRYILIWAPESQRVDAEATHERRRTTGSSNFSALMSAHRARADDWSDED